MSESLYVSSSGAISRMRQLEVVANNLANAATIGFKANQTAFGSAMDAASQGDPNAYVRTSGVFTDFGGGSLEKTGRGLDVAIHGEGFFAVDTDAGVRYTRAGSFHVDPEGRVVTADGHPVLGEGGPIQAGGGGELRILAGGQVVDSNGTAVGALRVERFEDPQLLQKEGDSLFRAPAEAVGEPVVTTELLEQTLEQSNVKPSLELARMMILQRAFEASMRALQSDDQATERLLQEMAQ